MEEVIFPHINVCACCGSESEDIVCKRCNKGINEIKGAIKLNDYDEDVYPCSYYSANMRKLINEYKYKRNFYVVDYFAPMIVKKIRELDINDCIITYIPISKKNLKIRGFDQCRLLVKNVCRLNGMKYYRLLKKNNDVREQKHLLHEERLKNIINSFEVCGDVKNKKIIVVDDVITTGSTLYYAKKALLDKDAKKVFLIAVAKSTI